LILNAAALAAAHHAHHSAAALTATAASWLSASNGETGDRYRDHHNFQ